MRAIASFIKRHVHLRVSLMRVDDVESAPVPELHVYLSWSILVITGNDESSAFRSEFTGQIQRLLGARSFDHTLATTPVC
jgi:hypothetical protein